MSNPLLTFALPADQIEEIIGSRRASWLRESSSKVSILRADELRKLIRLYNDTFGYTTRDHEYRKISGNKDYLISVVRDVLYARTVVTHRPTAHEHAGQKRKLEIQSSSPAKR